MTIRTRAIGSVLLVALVALAGASGFAAAASAGSVTSNPADPGATATHTVTATVTGGAAGGSWTGLAVNYSSTDVSNVGQNDIVKIGIDRGDDQAGTAVDVNASNSVGSVNAENNGHKLLIGLDGSYSLHKGDEVVVVYKDVQNPSAGSYGVGLDVNPQSSGGETSATLHVGSTQSNSANTNSASASTSSTTSSAGSSDSGSSASRSNSSNATTGSTTTQAQSPGFGVAVGAFALIGAALVALRREN